VKAFKAQMANAFADFEDELHTRLITNVMSVNEMKEQDEITDDIFRRLKDIPLIDRYAAYQALSDNWQNIVNDIETLQSDGFDAARTVEEATKLVKKGDEEIEVPDGLKGRVIPFDMIQQEMFADDLAKIANMQQRVEDINGEVDELRDSFTEDEGQEYLDADDNTKVDKAKIKKDAKAKGDEIEADTKAKLKKMVALWDEQTKVSKAIKAAKIKLESDTVHAIQNLTAAGQEAAGWMSYDVVGPVCESSDTFGHDYRLPHTRRGDIIAIRSAGAYGESMASTYNMRPLPGSITCGDE
jgi:type I restriction enzyme M protein